MSRPLRIEYPDAWYHVINRARRGESLYLDSNDHRGFLDLLQDTADVYDFRISAYCLMRTHYHLLVQTPNANLARCMRHINGVYTQRYNRRYGRDGTLFRGRYKSILIDADSYLLQLVRYIHKNPVRAGLVDEIDQYPWSSHKGYVSYAKKWDWLHKDFIISILSPDNHQRIRRYNQFVNQPESEEIHCFFSRKNIPAILGRKVFMNWVKDTFYVAKRNHEIPESKILSPNTVAIMQVVCQFYRVDPEKLLLVKRGTENEPRNVAIYLTRKLCGAPLLKIGSEFNLGKHSSVSSVIERMQNRLKRDRQFRKRVEKLKNILMKGQAET